MTFKTNLRPYNRLQPIPFEDVDITDEFWSKRQKVFREKSIFSQHSKLEEYRHIDNFRIASGLKKGIFRGIYFFDSDLYKWLEAACLILHKHKDTDLEKKVDEIVDLIVEAQEENGYLNTYYSIMFPDKKFSNLLIMHELYCMGHFFEAAVAHKKATGKETLLRVVNKCVDHLIKVFMHDKLIGAPGHEEIELALISLYRLTNEQKYLDLAKEFLERRGNIPKIRRWAWKAFRNTTKTLKSAEEIVKEYELESNDRYEVNKYHPKVKLTHVIKGVIHLSRQYLNGKYAQLDIPIRRITKPVGHAVRAMYLYIAMADLYSEMGDELLLKALETIWERMVEARMYITGGTGSVPIIEGFGKDYKLDNFTSYSETCAAIGNMLWNWRMSQITADAKYADLIEKLMYNGMLVGPSIDGETYMYNNPLASRGNDIRRDWYMVACCPSNIARTISSIEKFIYSTTDESIWVHQYIGSKATLRLNNNEQIIVNQESRFPWDGDVKITIDTKNNLDFSLFLRIPKWCASPELSINDQKSQELLTPGTYIEIRRNWKNKDQINLKLPMNPKFERADTRIKVNRGRVAISNGPIIYCMEQFDNKDFDIFKAIISEEAGLKINYKTDLLGGINTIEGELTSKRGFTAIPYYARLNRGPGKMQVWIKSISQLPRITTKLLMENLTKDFQPITDLIFKLKIKDMMDARYLQIKLKELVRKGLVLEDVKMGKKQWKLK